jgi:ribonuclease BN (tRNA processing enzyme)
VIIEVLSATIAPRPGPDLQYASSYLVNKSIAIDAGTLGFVGSPECQSRVRHVLLTHTHLDHIATLPVFVENIYSGGPDCVTIYGSQSVLDCLQTDFFNGRVWPDFIGLSRQMPPFLRLEKFEPGDVKFIDGVQVEAIAVDHVVPTSAFLLRDSGGCILFATDTGPTSDIWKRANEVEELKAVFLEATFPNELEELAVISKHLTPRQFALEVAKLAHKVPVYALHLKGRYREKVAKEIMALRIPGVEVAEPMRVYSW